MEQQYCIVATNRDTRKREVIAGPMSLEDTRTWMATGSLKRYYKYFRRAAAPKVSKHEKTIG